MKMIMKTYMKYLSVLCLLSVLFVSCAKDDDSNPRINTTDLSLTLLESAYPTNVLMDLSNSETFNLKVKEQPNYGYPAITIYSVQVSLDPAFASVSPTDANPSVKYATLASTYTKASMDVDAMELNNAIIKLYQSANNGEDPTGKVLTAYVRVKAQVDKAAGTECYSNVIKINNLTVAYVASIPKALYLSGTSVRGGSEAKEWAPVYGFEGCFYTLAYFSAGDTFFWGDSEDTGTGFSRTSSIDDQAGAGIDEGTDGGIMVKNAGWYVIYMVSSIDKVKNALVSDITIYPGAAFVIGNAAGGDWTDSNPEWQMVAPTEASGIWESPAFTASGELRAYIKVPGIDWWRTEFTLFKGSIFWRTVDIPSNWNENVGSAYSVACSAGQKLYVNFDALTGEVK